jgi:acetyl esterase/lipase
LQREERTVKINGTDSMSRKHRTSLLALALMAAVCLRAAGAQGTNNSNLEKPAASAVTSRIINVWPGVAPGSEQWKQKETTLGSGPMQRIVNVTTPTLTAYLPDPAKATGTAVIIAPGGGFIFLGTDTHEIAEWLAAHGIAGFVLKYRTAPLEGENEARLNESGGARFAAQLRNHALIAQDGKYGIADGIQSIKVVRAGAAEFGVSPDRIVFMGFSAGGSIAEFASVQPDVSASELRRSDLWRAFSCASDTKRRATLLHGDGAGRQSCRPANRRLLRRAQSRRIQTGVPHLRTRWSWLEHAQAGHNQ